MYQLISTTTVEGERRSTATHEQGACQPRQTKDESEADAANPRASRRERGDGQHHSDQQQQCAVTNVSAVIPAAAVGGAEGVYKPSHVDDGDGPAGEADAADNGRACQQTLADALAKASLRRRAVRAAALPR